MYQRWWILQYLNKFLTECFYLHTYAMRGTILILIHMTKYITRQKIFLNEKHVVESFWICSIWELIFIFSTDFLCISEHIYMDLQKLNICTTVMCIIQEFSAIKWALLSLSILLGRHSSSHTKQQKQWLVWGGRRGRSRSSGSWTIRSASRCWGRSSPSWWGKPAS